MSSRRHDRPIFAHLIVTTYVRNINSIKCSMWYSRAVAEEKGHDQSVWGTDLAAVNNAVADALDHC